MRHSLSLCLFKGICEPDWLDHALTCCRPVCSSFLWVTQYVLASGTVDQGESRMNWTRRSLLLAVGASVGTVGNNQAALAGISIQEDVNAGDDVVRQVSDLVQENFYDPTRIANFDETVSKYKIVSGKKYDYRTAIRLGLDSLKASHNEFYTPEDLDYYELLDVYLKVLTSTGNEDALKKAFPPDGMPKYDGIGIVSKRSADGWYISDIYDASPAAHSSLEVGDVVLTADGLPFDPILSFRGKAGRTVTLTVVRTQGGRQDQVNVDVVSIRPNSMTDSSIEASVRTFDLNETKIGYMRLWTYSTPDIQEVVQRLLSSEPLKTVSGLILDMRCRRGGAPPDAADTFVGMTPEQDMAGRSTRIITNFRYRKPIIGLIDAGTRSGMEVFAYSLRRAGVALVGNKTEGAVLGGSPFLLKDSSFLSISVMDVTIDGHVLEGIGVSPDFDIPYSKLYSKGYDPQVEKARDQLFKILHR